MSKTVTETGALINAHSHSDHFVGVPPMFDEEKIIAMRERRFAVCP